MSQKIDIDGVETEVFTEAEVAARETAAKAAVEGQYKPQLEDLTGKLTAAEQAAAARAVEFGQFRKLTEDQVKQLSEKDAIIYANQLALEEERKKNATAAETTKKSNIDAAIRAQVGTDQKVFDEAKKMYELIGIEDNSPEGIATRVKAAIGALGTTAPDLLAAAGFAGGSFEPPKPAQQGDKSFADTEQGKQGAAELGIIIEAPKK